MDPEPTPTPNTHTHTATKKNRKKKNFFPCIVQSVLHAGYLPLTAIPIGIGAYPY